MWGQRTGGALAWAQQDHGVRGPLEEASVLSVMPALLLKSQDLEGRIFSKESQDQAWDVKSEYSGHEGDIHISEGHGFTPSVLATRGEGKPQAVLFFLLPEIKKKPTLCLGRQCPPTLDYKGISHWSYFK